MLSRRLVAPRAMTQVQRRFAAHAPAAAAATAAATGTLGPSLGAYPFIQELANHAVGVFSVSTFTNVGALAMSPIGTAVGVLAAYNVCVVGLKHLWYTLELTIRDYLQDQILAQWFRYLVLWMLLISVEQTLIEA